MNKSELIAAVSALGGLSKADVEKATDATITANLGLSQSKFADRYGLERSVVQQWEQGRRRQDRAARLFLRVIEQNPTVAEAAAKSVA